MNNINGFNNNTKKNIRSGFFRILLKLLRYHTPFFIKNIELQILLYTTARGFGERSLRVWDKSYKKALSAYKNYTRHVIRRAGCNGFNAKKLYDSAYKTGSLVRIITGFTRKEDIENLVFYLYQNIEIDMKGDIPGIVTVSRCYFGEYYKPYECRIMSLVDSGIIAGINGGGRLKFTKRITEGCANCRACFDAQDRQANGCLHTNSFAGR